MLGGNHNAEDAKMSHVRDVATPEIIWQKGKEVGYATTGDCTTGGPSTTEARAAPVGRMTADDDTSVERVRLLEEEERNKNSIHYQGL